MTKFARSKFERSKCGPKGELQEVIRNQARRESLRDETNKPGSLAIYGKNEPLVRSERDKLAIKHSLRKLSIHLARISHQDHGSRRRIRVRKRRSGAKSVAIATV